VNSLSIDGFKQAIVICELTTEIRKNNRAMPCEIVVVAAAAANTSTMPKPSICCC
jgi:hypothetical protein